jgi:hypothetical protein
MAEREMIFKHALTCTAILELDEGELGALDALVGYGVEPFLKVFYAELGKSYMERHEKGLRSLFERVASTVPRPLSDLNTARRLLHEAERQRQEKWARYDAEKKRQEHQNG